MKSFDEKKNAYEPARFRTRRVYVGNVAIGAGASVPVQSMTNAPTASVKKVVDQIKRLEDAGCQIIRAGVPDEKAARSLGRIRKAIKIPLVADIHFNYRLALNPPHGAPFRAIVAICGGVPGDWKDGGPEGTSFSRATPVLHVSTRQDEWYPLEKSAPYKDRLTARFASADQLFFDGGHRAPSAAFEEIRAFLARNG